jgi:uncharacterized protein YdeI (YjbR/CyaY-like superfamily)
MQITHFATTAALRRWLEANHATATELLLGFYKKASGKGGPSYQEAVDELLCFGWIDGVKRRVDDERYTHRITPRRPGSIWSKVNVGHVQRLIKAGKMHPTGLAAFQAHLQSGKHAYAFRDRPQTFPTMLARVFRANRAAWNFWSTQPPGYQRSLIHWVTSAKQPATRKTRLQKLMAASAAGRRLFQ